MSVRWRLGVLVLQLATLGIVTAVATGWPYSGETWFIAGLLVAVVNPQLLEPYYPRPADVLANSVLFFVLFLVTDKSVAQPGWNALAVIVVLFFGLASFALWVGAGTAKPNLASAARAARYLSQVASARLLYSAVFFLSLLEFDHTLSSKFWTLAVGWVLITGLGLVNWQSVFMTAVGQAPNTKAEAMIGPSVMLISAPEIPEPGTRVVVRSRFHETEGVVLSRIRRPLDVWGRIHLADANKCERLVGHMLALRPTSRSLIGQRKIIGTVDTGSTHRKLRFIATEPLEIGRVVSVPMPDSNQHIIYQLAAAQVDRLDVKGGSHYVIQVEANQLGIYDHKAMWLRSHRWVPPPGQVVYDGVEYREDPPESATDGRLLVGHVIGTSIPVFLDMRVATEGHIAVLGMTKMGKSTLAARIARKLGDEARVVVLDQTGEYVHKKGFPPCGTDVDWSKPGVSVFEPQPGEIPAKKALEFLQYQIQGALEEYKAGAPQRRFIIIDEAHQFIPEPAGLGFNAPGRDQSYQIGLLMMQIRKYGISIMLVSQRTAVVAKSALSQCENLVAFRSVDQTGLDYLEAVAGSGVRSILPQLKHGEALVFGPAISSDMPVAVTVLL